jgi:hypothetical protein
MSTCFISNVVQIEMYTMDEFEMVVKEIQENKRRYERSIGYSEASVTLRDM